MKSRDLCIRLKECEHPDDLSEMHHLLVKRAIVAAKDAYAPYSHYQVGVALMLENGRFVSGNNQENAAYPSGLCAERVALFHAGSEYPDLSIQAMAIVAINKGILQEEPVTPCGACRQVIVESEWRGGRPIELILYGTKRILFFERAGDLLPLPFVMKSYRQH